MWDLIVSVPDHCLSFYFGGHLGHVTVLKTFSFPIPRRFNKKFCLVVIEEKKFKNIESEKFGRR